ncbi:Cell division cycle protein 27 like protein A, partial [Dictyocoela roeselum]
MNLPEIAFRSWICRNNENTAFLLTLISEKHPQYRLLLAIHYYMASEYRRALFFLEGINTITSVYYECLCLLKIGEEQVCIQLLESLVSGKVREDRLFVNSFDIFLIKKTDLLFMIHLIAEAHVQNHHSSFALPYFKQAHKMFPLFTTFIRLLPEGLFTAADNFFEIGGLSNNNFKLGKNDPKVLAANPVCKINQPLVRNTAERRIDESEGLFQMLKEFYDDCRMFAATSNKRLVEKYKEKIPGIGSFFVSYAGKMMSDVGKMHISAACFELVRNADSTFLEHMDAYSTTLWQLKDTTVLGLLGKDMLRNNRFSHVTWSVLGNFFSQYGDHGRAIVCFKRSIRIKRNPYAYTLL